MSTAFAEPLAATLPPLIPMEQELEQRALTIPQEARLIVVRDQASLDTAGAMLTERIKPLRKEAADVFDPIISGAHQAHKTALAGKARVEAPLIEAEKILKVSVGAYLEQVEKIRQAEEDRLRREQEALEAEERIAAESRRREEEAALNKQLEEEHALEIERQLDALPADASPEVIAELCGTPAPEPIRLATEMPTFAPAPVVAPTVAAPRGVGLTQTWSAEVTSIQLLCRAIAEGRLPAHYVEPNMTALNALARANKKSFDVPGCKAVTKSTVSARGR